MGNPPLSPWLMSSLHHEESHRFSKSTGQFGDIFSLMITQTWRMRLDHPAEDMPNHISRRTRLLSHLLS